MKCQKHHIGVEICQILSTLRHLRQIVNLNCNVYKLEFKRWIGSDASRTWAWFLGQAFLKHLTN